MTSVGESAWSILFYGILNIIWEKGHGDFAVALRFYIWKLENSHEIIKCSPELLQDLKIPSSMFYTPLGLFSVDKKVLLFPFFKISSEPFSYK